MNNKEILNSAINTLNEAFSSDPFAIKTLFGYSIGCNDALADHPTIQVLEIDGETVVRILGIINGILEPICSGRVAAIYDEAGDLTGFTEYIK